MHFSISIITVVSQFIYTGNEDDPIRATEHERYKRHARAHKWKEINEHDLQIFMALVIIMGLVKKPKITKYWAKSNLTATPLFGKYMSRVKFESILRFLHIVDNSADPGIDPLYKIRPFIEMCRDNFRHIYKPGKEISIDEACCPFKGRLKFLCYNPQKPNKFHIKLYQVCEATSGYVIDFEVYSATASDSMASANPFDDDVGKTTKLVLGLLENTNLLDKGHEIFTDNYYTSVELAEELFARDTYFCGTARMGRKGMPNAFKVVTSRGPFKMNRGDVMFRRKGPVLALRWQDKRQVTLLSTIHEADEIVTNKKDKEGNYRIKPRAVVDYTSKMRGCDVSDQLVGNYTILRRSIKWWRKLFFHLFGVILGNAYVLHRKYGSRKMLHEEFLESVASALLNRSQANCTCVPQYAIHQPMEVSAEEPRLVGRHFIENLPVNTAAKRQKPVRDCHACNFTITQARELGFHLSRNVKRKLTSYRCKKCKVALCIKPCFEFYHTKINYRKAALEYKLQRQGDM